MKTLSVIIPNYNNIKYLPQCIESVLAQTYPIEEIVIYDDCSTDGSRELLKEYAANQSDTKPSIRLILPDENKGVSIARDTAIRSCHTDYVTTLDADDFLYDRDKLLREMLLVNQSDTPICTFSQTVTVNEEGEVIGDMEIHDLQKDFRFRTTTQLIGSYVARDLCFPLDAYLAVDGFIPDMKLFEDWNLSLKLLSKCDFRFTKGYGTAYRQKSYGLSHVDFKRIFKGKLAAFRKARPYIKYKPSEVIVFYLRACYCFLLDAYLSLKARK